MKKTATLFVFFWFALLHAQLSDALVGFEGVKGFYVQFPQADLSEVPPGLDKEAKGRLVYDLLSRQAERTQKNVRQMLDERGVFYRNFLIVNTIFVKGDASLAQLLSRQPGVVRITAQNRFVVSPIEEEQAFIGFRDSSYTDWGLVKIGADKVWEMGIRGEGVVVAGGDTGYDWTHPAIKSKYRGYDAVSDTAVHDYNWHDAIHSINPLHGDTMPVPELNPCGLSVPYPCDDNRHGTHTMGTMVGADSINKIGVAPGAKWIACRNMERGYGTPMSYLECFEWFLAPTDLDNANPDPAKAPHVINNSWSCPPMEGCDTSNFFLLESAVNALKAAGIVVVVSAGNTGGQGCGSVSTPAAIFENSFSVGATRSNDTIAGFSSRGPVFVDSSERMKPDVSAPGVGVLSSIPGNRYARFSGTSMAGPHVAGAVALMISANPDLAGQVDEIEQILEETAYYVLDSQCTQVDSLEYRNNVYGHGRIDVYEAVLRALDFVSSNTAMEPESDRKLKVFPNPFDRRIHLIGSEGNEAGSFLLYDLSGRLIFRKEIELSGGQGALDIELPIKSNQVLFYRYLDQSGEEYSGKLVKW